MGKLQLMLVWRHNCLSCYHVAAALQSSQNRRVFFALEHVSCLAELLPPSSPVAKAESCWGWAMVLFQCGEVLEMIFIYFYFYHWWGWVSLQLLICGTLFSVFTAVADVWKKIQRCFPYQKKPKPTKCVPIWVLC